MREIVKTIMNLKTPDDIPAEWPRLKARKKTLITMRVAVKEESFKVSWQDSELVSDPALDYIITQKDGAEYPCKKDIFKDTYEYARDERGVIIQDSQGRHLWRKKELSTLVQVPQGVTVSIETLEGKLNEVNTPDYIVIGKADELYANRWEWAETNLEFITE